MKKFLFSLTMLAAVALAGFTTSCNGGGDDDSSTAPSGTIYKSVLTVGLGIPDNIDQSLGSIEENVKIISNSTKSTLDLSIRDIDLTKLNDPAAAAISPVPFNIELKNVPYTETADGVSVDYVLPFDLELWKSDVAININGNKAYLVSLKGDIVGESLNMQIHVVGSEDLGSVSVVIDVEGTKK